MDDAITLRELLEAAQQHEADLRDAWAVAHRHEHAMLQRAVDQTASMLAQKQAEANEWRGTLADLSSKFLLIVTYEAKHESLRNEMMALLQSNEKRIKSIEEELATSRGRASGQVIMWGIIVTVTMMLIGGASIVLTHLWH